MTEYFMDHQIIHLICIRIFWFSDLVILSEMSSQTKRFVLYCTDNWHNHIFCLFHNYDVGLWWLYILNKGHANVYKNTYFWHETWNETSNHRQTQVSKESATRLLGSEFCFRFIKFYEKLSDEPYINKQWRILEYCRK